MKNCPGCATAFGGLATFVVSSTRTRRRFYLRVKSGTRCGPRLHCPAREEPSDIYVRRPTKSWAATSVADWYGSVPVPEGESNLFFSPLSGFELTSPPNRLAAA